ncbi:hypothetical protein GCM10011494_23590 [Novosphingobium endophyticum]|uniref:17 kDa surface antigen n=1 Tax=Novosphingobium endophyticum TaxID=1955250 RepID=A0A916TTS6_9SPHN|nr:glycine zipper 2TM domain-containing protein [Novosphingobium endophyticum]GGC04372.1 hypothetical protein GCM10011494_23590 [Novosphingobium endophyticum]
MRLPLLTAVATATVLTAQPALAHDGYGAEPAFHRSDMRYGFDPAAREAWLADCRHRLSARDSGLGSAVIGGVVGGLAGNRIAGSGNRAVGTIAGAAVGAAAGAAIDKAEDANRNRDECEAYLDDYYARYTHGGYYPAHGYAQGHGYPQGYGYPAAGCCMAARPVMMVPVARAEPECTETIEYVYEDVPARPAPSRRYIPRPSKIVPDKRVPIK